MRRILGMLKSRRDSRRGNIMVEFAVGSGVLMAAFAGTFQFGYTFYQYSLLRNAVSAGARYASVRAYNAPTCTSAPSTFVTAVQNVVAYGDPSGGTSPVAPSLDPSYVNLTPICTNGVPTAMQVSLSGYTISGVFGSQLLTKKPMVTYPYVGIYKPY